MGDRGSLEKLVTRDEGLLQRDIVSADFGCVHLTRFGRTSSNVICEATKSMRSQVIAFNNYEI